MFSTILFNMVGGRSWVHYCSHIAQHLCVTVCDDGHITSAFPCSISLGFADFARSLPAYYYAARQFELCIVVGFVQQTRACIFHLSHQ